MQKKTYVADVGGFFGNPPPEMLVRWYWVGAFSPFFRAHAHLDSKRREPYLLDEPYKSTVREILRLRYALLPVWYTAFRETSVTGLPLLRCVLLFSANVRSSRLTVTAPTM
jgi:alpha 1,3-glucosidase